MGLKEQAQALLNKTLPIEKKVRKLQDLCNLVLTAKKINGDVIEFTLEDKQKVIQQALTLIEEIQVLVDDLP